MKFIVKTKNRCPVCNAVTVLLKEDLYDTRFGVRGAFDFYKCGHCQLIAINQTDIHRDTKELYESYYNCGKQNHFQRYDRIKSWFFNSILYKIWLKIDGDICFHAKKGHGTLLDAGCNEGAGLEIYEKNGYDVQGLELNRVAAQTAREKGFTVTVAEMETYTSDHRFDVVVLSNILEHSRFFHDMLQRSHQLLKPTGEIWISTPNAMSLFRKIYGKFWINWHVPFHLNIFSEKALSKILKETGFTITKTKFITPSLWNAQSIISVIFSKRGAITRQNRSAILIGSLMMAFRLFFFPILYLINQTKRGDCMVIQARKINNMI